MRAHPYADRFPMLGTEELERLAADIAENGLQNPIVLDVDRQILDGRNRWAACELAGVVPETVLYEGDDLAAFVLSQNVSRRHLTTGQQAMSTGLVLADAGRRENGRWKRNSINQDSGLSQRAWKAAMEQAGQVLDHAPDLADSVVAGDVALDAAYREAESRRDAERDLKDREQQLADEEEAAREHLTNTAPEYLDRFKTARQALAAWEDDNKRQAAEIRQQRANAEREAAELRKARTDLYTGIARALQTISGYGGYGSIDKLMADYDPSLISPTSMAVVFSKEKLAEAANFINMLTDWEANK